VAKGETGKGEGRKKIQKKSRNREKFVTNSEKRRGLEGSPKTKTKNVPIRAHLQVAKEL